MRTTILFLLLSVFSVPAWAEDYYWKPYGMQTHYTSAELACKGLIGVGTPSTWTFRGYTTDSTAIIRYCVYDRPEKDNNGNPAYPLGYWSKSNLNVRREGTTCPPGQTYNDTTFMCEGDPCLSTVGQVIYHGHTFRNLGADGNPDVDPPIAICSNACQYTHTFESFTSKRKGDQLEGSFKYKGNGVSCTASSSNPSNFDQPPSKPPMSPQQEYFSEKSCDNWVTDANGTATRTCLSKNYFREPGRVNCGVVNGKYECLVGSPSPNSKETNVTEKTDVTLNSDGSKFTTTNASTSTTLCKGLAKCTTSTKQETKTEGTNPDGSPGDTTSECQGEDCVPEEEQEEGEGEEPQEEEGIPGPGTSLVQGQQGSFDDAHSQWDDKIETATFELQSKLDQYASQFSGVFNLNLGGGSGSLPCEQVPITINHQTTTLDMCLEHYSEPLGYLRFAILLAATVLAAFIILR